MVKQYIIHFLRLSLLFSFVFYGLFSCGSASMPKQMLKALDKKDSCALDPLHSYEVFIPERTNPDEKLALLVIIDAHGSGRYALNKFRQGAGQYPAILVASNRVKNGFADYQQAIRTLIEDVRQKYPVGETLFISGFSGGARMALDYALTQPTSGLILCGALADAGQISTLGCPLISICGMDDFNFIETAQYLFQEQRVPANLKIELTDASHNWPDSLVLTNALGFLQLSSPDNDIPERIRSQIAAYNEKQQTRISAFKKQGEFLKAALLARNMSTTEPFSNDKTFAASYRDLKNHPEYISQLERLKKSLEFEINLRPSYINALMNKDPLWWKNELKTIQEKIKTEQNAYTVDMYRRIKAFWGIACYSLSSQKIREHNAEALHKIMAVYRILEPHNPDMFYFSAFPYLWEGNNEAALSMLNKAREAGFTDMGRLKTDFPPLISSRIEP